MSSDSRVNEKHTHNSAERKMMDETVNGTRTTNEWNQRAKLQQIQPTKRTNECTQSLCHRMNSCFLPRQTLKLQRRQRAKMNEQLNEHHYLNQGPIHNHVSTRRVVVAVCCDSGAVLTPAECMHACTFSKTIDDRPCATTATMYVPPMPTHRFIWDILVFSLFDFCSPF